MLLSPYPRQDYYRCNRLSRNPSHWLHNLIGILPPAVLPAYSESDITLLPGQSGAQSVRSSLRAIDMSVNTSLAIPSIPRMLALSGRPSLALASDVEDAIYLLSSPNSSPRASTLTREVSFTKKVIIIIISRRLRLAVCRVLL